MFIQLLARLGENTSVDSDPGSLGRLIGTVFNMAVTVGGLFVLFQMLMGALSWINSQGDKEKITKAQKQITNALIGLVLLVLVWVLFFTIAGDILGIFTLEDGDWQLVIPHLFGN